MPISLPPGFDYNIFSMSTLKGGWGNELNLEDQLKKLSKLINRRFDIN